jgi:outer membrane protein
MKNFKVLCVVLLLAVVALPLSAHAMGAEVAVGVWNHNAGGDLGYKGDSLSLDKTLGFGKETRFSGRAKIDMPLIIPNVYLMATPMNFEGNGSVPGGFDFAGTHYGAGAFKSKLNLDHYDFALYYGVPFLGLATLGNFHVDAGLNLRIINVEARIDQASTNYTESKSFTLPVPMLYLEARFTPTERFSVEGEFRGISYNASHFYDMIGRVKYKVIKVPLLIDSFIAGGYRYEGIKIDSNDVKADMNFSGPFFEVGVEF